MKKFFCLMLAIAQFSLTLALAGCGDKSEDLKFGMGIYSYYSSAKDASEDQNGSAKVSHTVAALLIDKDGKIVDIEIDSADNKGEYTIGGEYVAVGDFKTKDEAGAGYGMSQYGSDRNGDGVVKEWNEQADAFEEAAEGKTLEEVKALAAEDGYGIDEVINAGCTIAVSDFIKAIEKAFTNAVSCKADREADVELGIVSFGKSNKNATSDADGVNQIDTVFAGTLLGEDDKVIAMSIDYSEAKFTFDVKGASTLDVSANILSKKEKGDSYGMAKYGSDRNGDGVVKEWYEQAKALEDICVGKTASEIMSLVSDEGYGSSDVQSVGCTIYVSDMVKAMVKAAD